jgi:hypothetical protein
MIQQQYSLLLATKSVVHPNQKNNRVSYLQLLYGLQTGISEQSKQKILLKKFSTANNHCGSLVTLNKQTATKLWEANPGVGQTQLQ